MSPRRRGAVAAGTGVVLFAAACLAPRIGLAAERLNTDVFRLYGDRTLAGMIPYRDFSLEYPPGALPAFVLPSLAPARDYGGWFEAVEALFGAAAVALVAAALTVLGARRVREYAGVGFAALAPLALGPVVLNRYDLWPAALCIGGLAAVLAGRNRAGFAALGVGAAAKLFPVVLVPLGALYVARRDGARAAKEGVVAFAVAAAAVFAPFVLAGPGGVAFGVERQAGRALQIESIGSSLLLALHQAGAYAPRAAFGSGSWNLAGAVPDALATVETLLQLAALAAVWWLFARSRRGPEELVLAAAAAVAVFVLFGRVLSPQFLVWLVPLVALVRGRRGLAAGALLLAALVLTRLVYPARYDALVTFHAMPVWLLVARNALLLALAATLLAQRGIASRRKYPQSATTSTRAS